MYFAGRFGQPWRQPPPSQPKATVLSKNANVITGTLAADFGEFTLTTDVDVPRTAVLAADFGDFSLTTDVDVPRTAVLDAPFGDFTLSATTGTQNNAVLTADFGDFTLTTRVPITYNCPKFSEPTITGAEASVQVIPRC